jgi:hypothetical protein
MTTTYSAATIMLNGKAFDLADLSMAERRPSIDFAQPGASLAFEAVMPAPPNLGRLLRGVQTVAPLVDMHLPAGILGHVAVRGFVAGTTTRGDAAGTTVEMGVDVRDNAIRRALSSAVQRTIVERPTRVGVIARCALGGDRRLAAHAFCVLRKRGERKKRRAMRRLLRAAGVVYSG